MLIFDAHEDLAWNIMSFGRDYTRSAQLTRRLEAGTTTPTRNDDSVLGYPDYRRGQVAVVMGTLFVTPARYREGDWDKIVYEDDQQAHALYSRQLDSYDRLADQQPNRFRLLRTRHQLDAHLDEWRLAPDWPPPSDPAAGAHDLQTQPPIPAPDGPPVGIIIGMEGAEAIRDVGEVEWWYERGVRSIGPAWVGTRFCGGSREPGPLTGQGYALLERMATFNLTLDLTHMDEQAVLQALDVYEGPIIASHSNALSLLRGLTSNRHLSDLVLRRIFERGGVVGVVMYNAFLKAGWRKGDRREEVGLERIVAQIDYMCQMAGSAAHVGLGSDFDGGFGLQSIPHDLDTIADLQKLVPLLVEKGYTESDIAAILSGNMLTLLRRAMPESL